MGWCDFQHRSFSRTSFENAKFIGDAVYFSNATFSGWANFSRVKVITGLSTFSDAVFNTSASFRDSQLEWTDFNEVKFLDGCDFSDAIWAGIHFKGAEFGGQYAHFDRI